MGHHFLHSEKWWFCVSTINCKGVGSIRKILTVTNMASIAAGVVLTAASFFILRDYGKRLDTLTGRVDDLEYDRLREAYRQQGYEVD